MSDLATRLAEHYRTGHAAPPPDLFGDQRLAGVTTFRAAAVLVAITERERPGVLLIHRPSDMRAHPGEVAFPGGKTDPGETPTEAALREASEELGIAPDQVRVIGESDLYRTHSGFAITPVLATVPADIAIIPNLTEVAQWFEPPLDFVLDPSNQRREQVAWDGAMRSYYQIDWQGHRIWGVTAGLIVNLSRRLRWRG